jgi:putative FmdB family regulatory protein
MPIYEYRCSICNHQFESLQKVGARALQKCPECSGKLEKLVSRTSFQLKGGGWFDQGYGSKGGGAKPGASTKSSDATSDGAAKAKPSKPSSTGGGSGTKD